MSGKLYVVATPIGNVGDITYRAVEVLSNVAAIAAEDTRHSQRLLQHYQIKTPMFSLHDHNEHAKAHTILKRLQDGDDLALISDAGTPLISDPGYYLISYLRQQGITVVPIPGACAAIAALSISGLPTDQFLFKGFLASKPIARKKQLMDLINQTETLIFYEAPHRIVASLQDMQDIFGDRHALLARELTKTYETLTSGSLKELLEFTLLDSNQQKGEIVIIVMGKSKKNLALDLAGQEVMAILAKELPVKQAAKLAANISGSKKNILYNWWLTQVLPK